MHGVGAGLCLQNQLARVCVCLFVQAFPASGDSTPVSDFWVFFFLSASSKLLNREKKTGRGETPTKWRIELESLVALMWAFFIEVLFPAQTQYSVWVREEFEWGILVCSLLLLLWRRGFPEVKPLTRAVQGIPHCSPNCAGKTEAALCCSLGEEMSCRGGWEPLIPMLPPETSPRETTVFLMRVCAVVGDSNQLRSAERDQEEGQGPLLPLAAWAGSALLCGVVSNPLGCGITD